jgi:hypothetical protein
MDHQLRQHHTNDLMQRFSVVMLYSAALELSYGIVSHS